MRRALARKRSTAGTGRAAARLLAVVLLAAGVISHSGLAAVTGEEAAAKIRADYGVEILRVRAGTLDGVPVWLVTVMTPGGEVNDAFQVNTLAVDKDTGQLVPVFRPGLHAPAQPGEGSVDSKLDRRPNSMRSGTWR